MLFEIRYQNGCLGCDEVEEIACNSYEEAEEYAAESLHEFGRDNEMHSSDYDRELGGFRTEEDKEFYYDNLTFTIKEN